jgi:hypothetical protein
MLVLGSFNDRRSAQQDGRLTRNEIGLDHILFIEMTLA